MKKQQYQSQQIYVQKSNQNPSYQQVYQVKNTQDNDNKIKEDQQISNNFIPPKKQNYNKFEQNFKQELPKQEIRRKDIPEKIIPQQQNEKKAQEPQNNKIEDEKKYEKKEQPQENKFVSFANSLLEKTKNQQQQQYQHANNRKKNQEQKPHNFSQGFTQNKDQERLQPSNQNKEKILQKNNKDYTMNLKPVDWSQVYLQPFKKDFLKQHEVDQKFLYEAEEIDFFKFKHQIMIKSKDFNPVPFLSFENSIFSNTIKQQIQRLGFKKPTPIQAFGWPILLSGHDLIGIAETGSGKTLSYVLPAIVHLTSQAQFGTQKSPTVLILAPTRELTQQIFTEASYFSQILNIKCVSIYGGEERYFQKTQLSSGCHVLIATPGRLIDFIEAKEIQLLNITYLILDEADRMLDMGFEDQVRFILSQLRGDKQTCMWSAT